MPRVIARVYRASDGQLAHEYLIDGIGYGSIEAVEAALTTR